MNNARGYVKSALGFLAVILIVAGAIFSFDVKVDITDTNDPAVDETTVSTTVATPTQTTAATTASPAEDDTNNAPSVTTAPAVTTAPTEDENDKPIVTEPIVTEAEQTEAPSQTTEEIKGDEENA